MRPEIVVSNYIPTNTRPKIVSPVGVVGKLDGGVRLIHDCSAPPGSTVNDYATITECYKLDIVDTVISILEPGTFMAKVDIKAAYRHVPISEHSQQATGIKCIIDGHDIFGGL